ASADEAARAVFELVRRIYRRSPQLRGLLELGGAIYDHTDPISVESGGRAVESWRVSLAMLGEPRNLQDGVLAGLDMVSDGRPEQRWYMWHTHPFVTNNPGFSLQDFGSYLYGGVGGYVFDSDVVLRMDLAPQWQALSREGRERAYLEVQKRTDEIRSREYSVYVDAKARLAELAGRYVRVTHFAPLGGHYLVANTIPAGLSGRDILGRVVHVAESRTGGVLAPGYQPWPDPSVRLAHEVELARAAGLPLVVGDTLIDSLGGRGATRTALEDLLVDAPQLAVTYADPAVHRPADLTEPPVRWDDSDDWSSGFAESSGDSAERSSAWSWAERARALMAAGSAVPSAVRVEGVVGSLQVAVRADDCMAQADPQGLPETWSAEDLYRRYGTWWERGFGAWAAGSYVLPEGLVFSAASAQRYVAELAADSRGLLELSYPDGAVYVVNFVRRGETTVWIDGGLGLEVTFEALGQVVPARDGGEPPLATAVGYRVLRTDLYSRSVGGTCQLPPHVRSGVVARAERDGLTVVVDPATRGVIARVVRNAGWTGGPPDWVPRVGENVHVAAYSHLLTETDGVCLSPQREVWNPLRDAVVASEPGVELLSVTGELAAAVTGWIRDAPAPARNVEPSPMGELLERVRGLHPGLRIFFVGAFPPRVNLAGVRFDEVDLSSVVLERPDLRRADLTRARWRGAALRDPVLDGWSRVDWATFHQATLFSDEFAPMDGDSCYH
ncbi:MAG: pentapeptide repeat-containing protein, partial [Nocardioides sp.]